MQIFIFAFATVLFGATYAASSQSNDYQQVFRSLKKTGDGFTNVGFDGVARYWAANESVIDAAAMSPKQVEAWLKDTKGMYTKQQFEVLQRKFSHVDGRTVLEHQLMNPDASLIPYNDFEAMHLGKHKQKTPKVQHVSDVAAQSCTPFYCSTDQSCWASAGAWCGCLKGEYTTGYCSSVYR